MTVLESVHKILSKEWMPPFMVRVELVRQGHNFMSESAVTARIRECRKVFGVDVQKRRNGNYYEYRIQQ